MGIDELIDFAHTFKQHKAFDNYVQGFKNYYIEVMKLLPESKKTLEVGCAYGLLAMLLKERGDDVTTSDMTKEYTNMKMLKAKNIKFELLNIEQRSPKDKYDLITMTEVIEHLNSNPLKPIKRLYTALNPGGRLFVSTVMKEVHGDTTSMNTGEPGLYNDLESWKDIPEKYTGPWKDQHTFHYDQYNLITLLTEAGFEIEDLGNINNYSHWILGRKK